MTRVDLGSLILTPETGRELRLQVDERTQEVQAVILTGNDGALELRAFAAPRNGDLWSTVRPQVAADMARRGGTATEQEGPFGPELLCQVSMKNAEGKTGIQHSRIVGINGSRWMLRATFLGRPAPGRRVGGRLGGDPAQHHRPPRRARHARGRPAPRDPAGGRPPGERRPASSRVPREEPAPAQPQQVGQQLRHARA